MAEHDSDRIGALWARTGQHGEWFSGVVEVGGEDVRIVVFRTREKRSENSPDWYILRARRKDDDAQPSGQHRDERHDEPPPPTDDDLPF